jgi:hypothetical protein
MVDHLKSGGEIVDSFFDNLTTVDGLDKGVVEILKGLHAEKKLTAVNISNALDSLRDEVKKNHD